MYTEFKFIALSITADSYVYLCFKIVIIFASVCMRARARVSVHQYLENERNSYLWLNCLQMIYPSQRSSTLHCN